MRGDEVVGAADGAAAAVGGEDHDGGDGGFEGAVEVGEAFDVEHVDLEAGVSDGLLCGKSWGVQYFVDKEYAGDELGDVLVYIPGYYFVDFLP